MMKNPSRPTTTTRVSTRAGSRSVLRMGFLLADRSLPFFQDTRLVIRRPGAIIGHQLHRVECGSAWRWRHVLEHRQTVGELNIELARFLAQHPIDKGFCPVRIGSAFDDANDANPKA